MFLIFEGFQPQTVLILFLFSMKNSCLLTTKMTRDITNWGYFIKGWGHFKNGWFIGDIEYFNTTLEEYIKVIYPEWTCDCITKDDFYWRSGYSFVSKFFKNSAGSSVISPLSGNPTKWSNTLKQFVDKLPTNCLSVFDHFVGLGLKGLNDGFLLKTRFFNYSLLLKIRFKEPLGCLVSLFGWILIFNILQLGQLL